MLIVLQVYMNVLTLRSDSHGTPLWASYHVTAEHQQRYTRFEQYNQEHLRDMAVIDQLDQLITALHQGGIQPVSVLSGQAGMVFFYTAQKHFREVRFIDNRGLTEDSLLHCRLMDNVARSSQGLVFSVDDFFARQPGLNDQCHIPRPDIVYDLNDMTRQLPQRLEQNHYTLVHQDRGKILDAPTATGAFTLPSANFIMVANDLLDELGHPPLNITNYTEMRSVERW